MPSNTWESLSHVHVPTTITHTFSRFAKLVHGVISYSVTSAVRQGPTAVKSDFHFYLCSAQWHSRMIWEIWTRPQRSYNTSVDSHAWLFCRLVKLINARKWHCLHWTWIVRFIFAHHLRHLKEYFWLLTSRWFHNAEEVSMQEESWTHRLDDGRGGYV